MHNGSTASPPHHRNDMFGPQKHPLRVDRHEVIPLRFAGLLETLPEHNTGVIHQDIQLAIAVGRRAHRLDPIGVAGHIQMHVRRFAACGAYLGLDLVPLGIPDVAQYHLRAFAGKQFRLCRALAPGAAADQGHLPIESSHGSLLVLVGPMPALLASGWSSSHRASSCQSRRQSPPTMVFHHPWAAAWHAKVYPTQKRGRLARPLRARRDARFSGARLAGPQPCVHLRPSLASSRRIRRWSMRRDALGASGQTCTGAEAPAPTCRGGMPRASTLDHLMRLMWSLTVL